MKKILFLIPAFLLAFQLSNAQTQKGTQTLGLYLGYGHSSENYSYTDPLTNSLTTEQFKYTTTAIGPSYGYFIADGSEIGTNLSYNHTKSDNTSITTATNSNGQTSNTYSASIFFRKYVLIQNKFGFRAGPYAGYEHDIAKYTPDNFSNNNTSNGYRVGGNFDLVYYPTNKLGIAANVVNINYGHSTANGANDYKGKQDNFNFSYLNNGLLLTLFYVIGSK